MPNLKYQSLSVNNMKSKILYLAIVLIWSFSASAQTGYQVIQNEVELNASSVSKDSRYYQVRSVELKKGDIFLVEVSSKDLIPRMVILKNKVSMQPGMVDFTDKTNIKNFYAGEQNCVWAVKVTEDGTHDLYISTSEVNKGGKILLSYTSVSPGILTDSKLFPVKGTSELAMNLQTALRNTLLNNMQAGVNNIRTNIIENPAAQLSSRKNYVQNMQVDDVSSPLSENANIYRSVFYTGCYKLARAKFDSLKVVLQEILPADQWKGKVTNVKSFFLDPCAQRLDEQAMLYFSETYHFASKGYPELRQGMQTGFTAKNSTIVALRLAYAADLKFPTVEIDVYTADDETYALNPNNFPGLSKSK